MRRWLELNKKSGALGVAVLMFAIGAALLKSESSQHASANAPQRAASSPSSSQADPSVDLSPSQLNAIKIEPAGAFLFPVEKEAVGSISFADDLSVQVFPNYQGTIIKTFLELGDNIRKDQPLYTIRSPDLIQAESTLIGAAATFELTSKELARAKDLNGTCSKRQNFGLATSWSL